MSEVADKANEADEADEAVDKAAGYDAPVDESVLMDHVYDGIREYDNPLPGWWTTLFWLGFVIMPFYAGYYHYGTGGTVKDEFARDMADLGAIQAAEALKHPVSNENLQTLTNDPTAMASAKALFVEKCAECHRPDAGGNIGPNLTDDYWLYGHDGMGIYKTIADGTNNGMDAWKKKLSPIQLRMLSAYITTLKGAPAENPKAPQGNKVPKG